MASSSNVFVGKLPPHCDDELLRQQFAPFGAIRSLKVMLDPASGLSRGFGFVQFADPLKAAGAVAAMNGAQLDGKILEVKLADRDAGAKGPRAPTAFAAGPALGPETTAPSDNIFVGGIPHDWREAELNALFGTCGPILSSVVLMDRTTGRSKGAGLVRFANVAGAGHAVQTLNGYQIQGTARPLEVKFADQPDAKGAKQAVRQVLQQLRFSPYGSPRLPSTPTPMSNGSASGTFAHIHTPAVSPMSPMPMGSGTHGATGPIAMPKRSDIVPEEGSNLHIFGLDTELTELNLYQTFAWYGAIASVRVVTDKVTRAPKGYGFVQFLNAQDAQNAIAALNGLHVGTRVWQVSVHKKKE